MSNEIKCEDIKNDETVNVENTTETEPQITEDNPQAQENQDIESKKNDSSDTVTDVCHKTENISGNDETKQTENSETQHET